MEEINRPPKINRFGIAIVVLVILGLLFLNIYQLRLLTESEGMIRQCELRTENECNKVNIYWLLKTQGLPIKQSETLLNMTETVLEGVEQVNESD